MLIAIIGHGDMGAGLGALATRAGHQVAFVTRDVRERAADVLTPADLVMIAIPYLPTLEVASDPRVQAALAGKVVIDITNPLTSDYQGLIVGHTNSGAEEISKRLPGARMVKAFNTIYNQVLSARLAGELAPMSVFCAGDNPDAKAMVMALISDMGMSAIDAGPLINARFLEPMSVLMLHLTFGQGRGERIGFRLVEVGQKPT